MQVRAAKGLQCPRENKRDEYITDDKTVTVPDTAYYRRLVDDGSLVLDSQGKQKMEKTDAD